MWQIAALLGAGLGLWKSQYGAEGINNKLCVLCKKHYGKYGHNAQPLADGRCCDACNDKVIAARMAMMFGAEIMDATSEVIPPTPSTKELVEDGYMGTAATVQGYVTDWIPATWNAESVVNHKRGKVISMRGSDPRLRTLQKDKDISPEEARDRLEISAETFGAEGIKEYDFTAGGDYKWLKGKSYEGFYFTIVNSGKGAPYALIHRGYSWDKSKDDIKIPLMREGQDTWEAKCEECGGWHRFNENWCMFCASGLDCCDCEDDYDAETFNASGYSYPQWKDCGCPEEDMFVEGDVNSCYYFNCKNCGLLDQMCATQQSHFMSRAISAYLDNVGLSWETFNPTIKTFRKLNEMCYPRVKNAETFNAAVLHKKPKGYVGKAVAMDALMTQARIEEAMLQLETAVKLGLISEDEIMEQLQRQFGSEAYAGNYMVPADVKSLARSVKVLQSKARADQNQPEWWKSKLSVVAAELDDLTDFFDYAEDTGML